MATSKPSFTVSHVTSKEDFAGLTRVEKAAFGHSPAFAMIYPPSPTTPANMALSQAVHERAFATDPNARYLKASLADGTIVGLAKWYFLLDEKAQGDPWKVEFPADSGVNVALYDAFFGSLNRAREAVLGGKRHMLMAILAIDPGYQRMGIGHELLKWGLEEADREGVPCWIDASAAGYGLYKQFGWEEVGVVEVGLEEWGGKAEDKSTIRTMVRQPKTKA